VVRRRAAGKRAADSKAASVGKETEGTSNGAGHYRTIGARCGTLTKSF
jgi:hypothetical protein